MKKAIVPLALLATILVFTGIVVWLFYTETGAQYLVTRLIRFVPARIETAGISGTLASELAVRDLRVISISKGHWLTIGKASVQWRPWELPLGKVVLAKLVLREVSLQDGRPDEPIDLTWPRLPGALSWFQGRVDQLEIRGLAYRSGSREILIQKADCRVDYSYGFARVHDLLVEAEAGKMTGTIQTHLMSPFLAADVKIEPKGSSWPMTAFQARLRAPSGSMYVNGPFTAKIFGGLKERFTLKGGVSVDRHALAFTSLSLEERERKGAIKGEGKVDFSRAVPVILGVVRAEDLDLTREAGMECRLTGAVEIAGNLSSYQGKFRLRPYFAAWEPGEAAGVFSGDQSQASIEELRMNLGKGTIKGRMNITWEKGLAATVTLQARNIDPSRAVPEMKGIINADLEGFLRRPPGASVEAAVKGRFLSSQLMGKQLIGTVNARWKDEGLNLDDLSLQGDGFHVRARGDARDRILYEARVTKLSRLLPKAEGQFQGQGWFRFRNRLLSGNLVAAGKDLAFDHTTIESLTADLSLTEDGNKDLKAQVTAKNMLLWGATWRQAELKVGGTRSRHRADLLVTSPENGLRIQAAGSYQQAVWTGIIQDVLWDSKRFGPLTIVKPADIVTTGHAMSLAPLLLTGRQGEQLELAARMDGQKKQEFLSAVWRDLQLGRVNLLAAGTEMEGKTNGQMRIEWPGKGPFRLSGMAMVKGEILHGTWKLPIREGQTRIRWDEKGLDMRQSLDFGEKGKVAAVLSSSAPPAGAIPGEGTFQVRLTDMDLQLIKPLLPPSLETEGRLSGQGEGRLLPQQRFTMKGQSTVAGGAWTVAYPKGKVQFSQERLVLAWNWQDDALQGTLESKFANHGQIRSTFSLPIKAQIPLKIDKEGPLSIAAKGDLREKGLLSALFPGTVRETYGQLAIDLAMTGSWQAPIYQGTVRLDRAGAYILATGIRIEDVGAVARFYQDRIEVEQISARSGAGSIKGTTTLWYGDRKIKRVKGSLAGERFQAAYLPELQIMANPRLTFEGPPERLILRGAIDVPEGRYTESKEPDMIHTSRDVRVMDRVEKKTKSSPVVMDIDLSITLGEKVFMKTRDIEGKFTGKMNAAGRTLDNLRTRGEIHISQGILYAADTKLPIERGHIFFKDKPFPLASLDILAVKTVGDVRAGFLVTGTIRTPIVTLYSVPSMSDQDVLAHIVFGTSYTGDKIQAATLLKSAGMFLAQGQSVGLEDSLRKSAGLEIGGLTSPNRSKQGRTDMTTSLSTVGQYLSPQLYVGLGRALFSDDILYVMKYSFTKRWEVETKAGKQSSLDLFFKIEFD
ncbi:MAG: translocation/assembly module TamB domain-containing protein [Deltaproteobacteria bacterium]|nr:translocation/assembly module TamB domain-containing protein [Deltaproteobacteria bacterium]